MHRDDTHLLATDMQHLWHPCSQMKDYESFKPLIIEKASGSYLELADGSQVIDAISSWWCKSLGHQHPKLRQALIEQAHRFEHVILANTTNDVIVSLTQQLASLQPALNKVFYASEGASAVEIAMKMSVHTRRLQGDHARTKFIALQNSYHGETIGALSVSDLGLYRNPYQSMLFEPHFITSLPYVSGITDPLWNDCSAYWVDILSKLEPYADCATAIIVEPIVQAAGGMKIYSPHLLRLLRDWTQAHNIHLIADEIVTGLGRTGKMLACEHAQIEPDFICLAKGLTAGWLPLSAVLTTDEIYQQFYADYAEGKSFLHSHTYSGNALAASVAVAVLNITKSENICEQALQLGEHMLVAMQEIAANTKKLINVRGIGAIVAADLNLTSSHQRIGFEVYQQAVKMGALLRPIGNTIYWLPPLNMSLSTLSELKQITQRAINKV